MQEINLYKLLAFYTKNWLLILSLTLAGLLIGVIYNQFIQVPMYKSNATLLFINPGASTSSQDATLLNNYVQLFESRRVLEPVISEQKLGVTYDQFKPSVAAVNEKGTEVIKLSVSTDSSEKSQRFLKAAVQSFKKQAETLYGTDKLQVVDNASDASRPYNVNKALQLAIATGAGFVLSLIVLFFIFDAKGGVMQLKAAKVAKPAKVEKPKKRTPTNRPLVRRSVVLNGIKKYFTEYKENLMISANVEEAIFEGSITPPADTLTTQTNPTKKTNNK